nr:hypothetical protein 12 [bacterium]
MLKKRSDKHATRVRKAIQRAVDHNRYNQSELSRRTGLPQANISLWLRTGKVPPEAIEPLLKASPPGTKAADFYPELARLFK